jgi:hypothetical protein
VLSNGGKVAGWGAPLVVGWYNTATAAPEDQPKTALVEGAGIVSGSLVITGISYVGTAMAMFLVFSGAAPIMVVAVLAGTIVGAAVTGYRASEKAKELMEELIEEAGWEEPLRRLGSRTVITSSNNGDLLERAD